MKKPVAIITGASTGIGKSLAIKLSNKYFVYLISRNKEKLQKTADQIINNKNECQTIIADISKENSLNAISSKINNKEDVDLLINNAGIAKFKNISDLSFDDWNSQLDTNLKGSFMMTKMIINHFKAKKNGKIIFINSVAGLQPYKNSTAYVASKYGLHGFASSLREEMREYNVKVVSVYPGAIDTPLWNNMGMDDSRSEMMSVEDVSDVIINALEAPNNCTVEDITIRRIAGDF